MRNRIRQYIAALVIMTAGLLGHIESVQGWHALPVNVDGTWYSYYNAGPIYRTATNDTFISVDIYHPCYLPSNNRDVEYDYKNAGAQTRVYAKFTDISGTVGPEDGSGCKANASWASTYFNTNADHGTDNIQPCHMATYGATTDFSFYNLRILLDNHILLYDGTDFGTTSLSYNFGSPLVNTSQTQYFYLRSFLTSSSATGITVSSDNTAFQVSVGTSSTWGPSASMPNITSNSCGVYGDGNDGRINTHDASYAISVKFTPSDNSTQTGHITISDGTKTATITVTGTGGATTLKWTSESSTWYILKTASGNISTATAKSDDFSVYMPKDNGYSATFIYSFAVCKKTDGWWVFTNDYYPGIDMFVKTNNDSYNEDLTALGEFTKTDYTTPQSKTISSFPKCSTIRMGWDLVSDEGYNHDCNKGYTFKMEVPDHINFKQASANTAEPRNSSDQATAIRTFTETAVGEEKLCTLYFYSFGWKTTDNLSVSESSDVSVGFEYVGGNVPAKNTYGSPYGSGSGSSTALNKGDEYYLVFKYKPSTVTSGTQTATYDVKIGSTILGKITLNGTSKWPTIDFGSIDVGNASDVKTSNLVTTFSTSTYSVSELAGYMFSNNGTTWNKSLQNVTGQLRIIFQPEKAGVDYKTDKYVEITQNGKTYKIKVTGTATATPISCSETEVDSESSAVTVTLSKFKAKATLSAEVFGTGSSHNFVVSNASSGSYGKSCNNISNNVFYAKFKPQTAGTLSEVVKITDSGTGRVYEIPIKGTAKPIKTKIYFDPSAFAYDASYTTGWSFLTNASDQTLSFGSGNHIWVVKKGTNTPVSGNITYTIEQGNAGDATNIAVDNTNKKITIGVAAESGDYIDVNFKVSASDIANYSEACEDYIPVRIYKRNVTLHWTDHLFDSDRFQLFKSNGDYNTITLGIKESGYTMTFTIDNNGNATISNSVVTLKKGSTPSTGTEKPITVHGVLASNKVYKADGLDKTIYADKAVPTQNWNTTALANQLKKYGDMVAVKDVMSYVSQNASKNSDVGYLTIDNSAFSAGGLLQLVPGTDGYKFDQCSLKVVKAGTLTSMTFKTSDYDPYYVENSQNVQLSLNFAKASQTINFKNPFAVSDQNRSDLDGGNFIKAGETYSLADIATSTSFTDALVTAKTLFVNTDEPTVATYSSGTLTFNKAGIIQITAKDNGDDDHYDESSQIGKYKAVQPDNTLNFGSVTKASEEYITATFSDFILFRSGTTRKAWTDNDHFEIKDGTSYRYAQSSNPLDISSASQIEIKFEPTENNAVNGYLYIKETYGGNDYYFRVPLSGSGNGFEPVDFRTEIVDIGHASTTKSIDLSGISGATSILVSSDKPTIFRVFIDGQETTTDKCTAISTLAGQAIDATGESSVKIKYVPESATSEETGTVTVQYVLNGVSKQYAIEVLGNSTAPDLNFGTTPLATFATRKTFTLDKMVTSSNYTITSSNPNVFRIDGGINPVTKNGGEQFTIDFFPQAATSYDETITILDNATLKCYTRKALGTAGVNAIPDFGSIQKGSSSSGYTLTITNLPVASSFAAEYAIESSSTSFTVSNASASGATITFTPQTVGSCSGTINLRDKASGALYPLATVSGTGTAASASIQFGYSLSNLAKSSTARSINLANYVELVGSDGSIIPVTSWTFATSGTCSGFTLSGSNLNIAANATGSGKISITANGVTDYDIVTNPILIDVSITESSVSTCSYTAPKQGSWSNYVWTFDDQLGESHSVYPTNVDAEFSVLNVSTKEQGENCKLNILDANNQLITSYVFPHSGSSSYRYTNIGPISLAGKNISTITFKLVEDQTDDIDLESWPVIIASAVITQESNIKLISPSSPSLVFSSSTVPQSPHTKTQQTIKIKYSACGEITASLSGTDAGCFAVASNISTSNNCTVGTIDIPVYFTPTTGKGDYIAKLTLKPKAGDEIEIDLSGYCKKRDQIVTFTSPTQLSYVYSPNGHTISLAAKTNVTPFTGETGLSTYTYSIVSELSDDDVASLSGSTLTLDNTGTACVKAHNDGTDCTNAADGLIYITVTPATQTITWDDDKKDQTITTCTGSPVTLGASAPSGISYKLTLAADANKCASSLDDLVDLLSEGTITFKDNYPAATINVVASSPASRNYKAAESKNGTVTIMPCDDQIVTWTQNITVIDKNVDKGFKYGDRLALTAPTWSSPSSTTGGYHFTTADSQIVNVTKDSIYALHAGTTSVTAWQDATTCYNTEKDSKPNSVTVALTQEAMIWHQPNKKLERNAIGQSETAIGSNDLKSPYVINARHSDSKSGRTTYLPKNTTYGEVVVTELNDPTQYQYRTVVVKSSDTSLLPSKCDSSIVKFKDNKVIVTGYGSGKVKLAVTEKNGVTGKYCGVPDPATGSLFNKYEDSIDIVVKQITPSVFKLYHSGMPSDGLHYGDYITIDSIKAMLNDTTEIKDYLGKPIYGWAASWSSSTESKATKYYPSSPGYGIYIAPSSKCSIKDNTKIRFSSTGKDAKVKVGVKADAVVGTATAKNITIGDVDSTSQEIVFKISNKTINIDARTKPTTSAFDNYVCCVDTRHSEGKKYENKNGYLTKTKNLVVYYGTKKDTIQAVVAPTLLKGTILSQSSLDSTSCGNSIIELYRTTSSSKITPRIRFLGPAGTAKILVQTIDSTTSKGKSYYKFTFDTIKVSVNFISPYIELYDDTVKRSFIPSSSNKSYDTIYYGDVINLKAHSYYKTASDPYYDSDNDPDTSFSFDIYKTSTSTYHNYGRIINGNQFEAIGVGTSRLKVTQDTSCYVKKTSNNYYYYKVIQANRKVKWGSQCHQDTTILTNSEDISLEAITQFANNKGTTKDTIAGKLTYTILGNGSNYVKIEEGKLIITNGKSLPQSGEEQIQIKASFGSTNNFNATDSIWTFTLKKEGIKIIDAPATYSAADLTSTTANYDLIKALENLTPGMTTNYPDGKYSYSMALVDPATTVAKIDTVDGEQRLTAFEETSSSAPLLIKITATDKVIGTSDEETVKLIIGKGTLTFSNHEKGGKWTADTCWSRPDIVKKYIKNNNVDLSAYNVEIADSCFIGTDSSTVDEAHFMAHNVNVSCYDLTFGNNDKAKLVIGEASTLDVKNNLMNANADRFLLTANRWGQASVVFNNGAAVDKPKATIEMYVPEGNGSNTDPVWQYRGVAVDGFEMAGGPWTCMAIYRWDEAGNSDYKTGCWNVVTNGGVTSGLSLKPWVGYAFANICAAPYDTATWLTYKGTLINTKKDTTLSYHRNTRTTNASDTFDNVGINLITNSFAVPLNIANLDYPDDSEKGVILYNAGSHTDYRTAGGEVHNQRGNKGQYSTVPKNTGGQATDITTIPSGQGFFVKAVQGNAEEGHTLHINYGNGYYSIAPSDRMYMPALGDEPEFNILKINVISNKDSVSDRLYLVECETCTRHFDNGYDGKKMIGDEGLPQLYAYNKFGITAVNADSTFNKQYIGFNAGSDDESYTLSFETDKLFGYHSLYLIDRKQNQSVDILAGETYTFKGYSVGENMRFQINGVTEEEWQNQNPGDDDDDDQSICDLRVIGGQLYVQGFTTFDYPAATIELFDMTGNLVWSTPLTAERLYDLPSLPHGVYTVRLGDCHVKYMSQK